MGLEAVVGVLERLIVPGVVLFGLVFLVMSGLMVRRRLKFGSDSLGTTRLFLDALSRGRSDEVWGQLSAGLRDALSDERRAAVAQAQVSGVGYIAHFAERHASALPVGRFKLLSLHKVPLSDPHREMVMIRALGEGATRGLIVWLSRSTLSASLWAVEDVYVQPQPGIKTRAHQLTLSGRTPQSRAGTKLLRPGQEPQEGAQEGAQEGSGQDAQEEGAPSSGELSDQAPLRFEAPVNTPTPRADEAPQVVKIKA